MWNWEEWTRSWFHPSDQKFSTSRWVEKNIVLVNFGTHLIVQVIFLGADVTHPPVGDNRKPSIAAVVGSQDAHPSRFFRDEDFPLVQKTATNPRRYAATVRVQQHRQEIIQDLSAMVSIHLSSQLNIFNWFCSGEGAPDHVLQEHRGLQAPQDHHVQGRRQWGTVPTCASGFLLYSFPTCVCKLDLNWVNKYGCWSAQKWPLHPQHELTAIREACIKLEPDYKPGITFIVVQKRHHTRSNIIVFILFLVFCHNLLCILS